MRVLHLGKFYPPFAGGIEIFLDDLLTALETLGVQTGALVHQHQGAGPGQPGISPTDVVSGQPTIWRTPCLGQLLYTPISPRFPFWLRRIIRSWQPDLMHIHMPNPSAFWAMALPCARRIPWVVHWHSDVVASNIDRRLSLAYRAYRPFEQRLLDRCHTIIATTPAYMASSEALTGWQAKSIAIPLGLDPKRMPTPDAASLARAEALWQGSQLRILAVGRMTYYKGHEVLIRAVANLPEVKLLIVGHGDRRAGLVKLIRSLHLQDRVILLGYQPDMALNGLFASCDLVCLPSIERTEAFGLVLLEAMRHEKAVVAGNIPGSGVGWVVRHETTGLLVEPGNVASLTQGLHYMATHPEHRDAMGKAGGARFQQTFHINAVARAIKNIYAELIPTPGTPGTR